MRVSLSLLSIMREREIGYTDRWTGVKRNKKKERAGRRVKRSELVKGKGKKGKRKGTRREKKGEEGNRKKRNHERAKRI